MNIVVAVDGGKQQPSALALAAALARTSGGSLTVVNVYPWSRWSQRLGNEYELTVRRDAESIVADAARRLGDLPHATRTIASLSVPKALHDVCAELSADLLVVGSCHRGPIGRTVLGGTAERLVHGAPCPVAIAPHDFDDTRLTAVGVGYDASSDSELALEWAVALAEEAGARVELIGVVEPIVIAAPMGAIPCSYERLTGELREELREQLTAAAQKVERVVDVSVTELDGAAAERLATAARSVDLLVVGSRDYGPLRSIMLGSVGRALAHTCPRPLVIVPRGSAPARVAAESVAAAV